MASGCSLCSISPVFCYISLRQISTLDLLVPEGPGPYILLLVGLVKREILYPKGANKSSKTESYGASLVTYPPLTNHSSLEELIL